MKVDMSTADGKGRTDGAVPRMGNLSVMMRAHEPWLRRVLFNRLGDREIVDDVLQEVGLALSRTDLRPDDESKIAPWLYRVAVRQAYLARRKLGRLRRLMNSAADLSQAGKAEEVSPLEWLLGEERREAVRRAIQGLSELDREILILKYGESWTYKQLAERLGVSVHTVEHRLIKAKKNLRSLLKQEQVEVS